MSAAGQLARRIADQGWRGLLPLLPHDAAPHVRLGTDKAADVERGRGKAPGVWSKAGWSLIHDWRNYPDDADTIERWASWPGVNVGLRTCYAGAPSIAGIDADVPHHKAAAEILEFLRDRFRYGEFLWRVGNAPKFLVPAQVTEPVRKARSVVVEIDGQRNMVELLGEGQQFVVAGVHPVTGREYFWPAGGLEDTEPGKLPLVTPVELTEILAACSKILLRYGKAVGRQGRPIRPEAAHPKPLHELRAMNPWEARSAARFVINNDWTRADWVSWCYALRGCFGVAGEEIWLEFSAQSAKATNPDTAKKIWADATQAERDDLLRSGVGTILHVAREEGWTPPPAPGLPPYFDGELKDAATAVAELGAFITRWSRQARDYNGRSKAPRDAAAGGVALGKTVITLERLFAEALGRTVYYYAPTLELAAEVVEKARAEGLPAVLIRGREAGKDPKRFPATCSIPNEAGIVARTIGNVWGTLCWSAMGHCPHLFTDCQWAAQWRGIEGHLIVLAHEYLSLPLPKFAPKPDLVVVDEGFHTTLLLREPHLPLERVIATRTQPGGGHFRALTRDAGIAIAAVEDGKTMVEAGLTPERLKEMARDEERLVEAHGIWPGQDYAEQQKRVRKLKGTSAFKLARLWRVLAQDHKRVTQRVVVERNIKWRGKGRDMVFVHATAKLALRKRLPALLIDADHDPLIGAATLPTSRRLVITPKINATVIQVSDMICGRRQLLRSAALRAEILALARYEVAQGRRVLLVSYKPVVVLFRKALTVEDRKHIAMLHFGALRGLDGFKDFDTAIIAGREQPRPEDAENTARALFGRDPEPLLLTGEYVLQSRGYRMKDGSKTAVTVQVHPDLRVQAVVEQTRERGVEQAVGRVRPVHRKTPARVILLANLPTALPVDQLKPWDEVIPTKMEQAIVAGRGVLPLSDSELARAFPGLWANAREVKDWERRKGGAGSTKYYTMWNLHPLSVKAFEVSYRRPGQVRGSPHKAIVLADLDPTAALTALLGPVEQVTVVKTLWRPTVVIEDPGEPEPLIIPFPDSQYRLIPLPEASFAFSGNVTVQRTTTGRTTIIATTRRAARAAERRPEARVGP